MAKSFHPGFDRYSVAFPELGITYLGEITWPYYKTGRFHNHRENQFLFVLDGTMKLEIHGTHYSAGPGQMYVLPAEVVHNVTQDPDNPRLHFLDLRVVGEPGNAFARVLLEQHQVQLCADPAVFRALMLNLREALGLQGLRRVARLETALWNAVAELHPPHSPAESEPGRVRLRVAEAAMKDHLAHAIGVSDVARAAGVSRSQLTRLYMKHLGVGPAERLRQLRGEKAAELLRTSTLSVKEIAHVCGFVCANHFCRVFLAQTGATPTQFREQHWSGGRSA